MRKNLITFLQTLLLTYFIYVRPVYVFTHAKGYQIMLTPSFLSIPSSIVFSLLTPGYGLIGGDGLFKQNFFWYDLVYIFIIAIITTVIYLIVLEKYKKNKLNKKVIFLFIWIMTMIVFSLPYALGTKGRNYFGME